MHSYLIKDYQAGFEPDQARIGREVAQDWIWPYAYDLADLVHLHAQPDFDPGTRHYCFLGDEMMGYICSVVSPAEGSAGSTAHLDFPRMKPGHEPAAELLIERALERLTSRGVSRAVARATTMCPGDIRLAEKTGFLIRDWGYKVYNLYEMGWGKLNVPGEAAQEVDPDLVNDHRPYEPVYRDLGFRKAAEWARCEKTLG